METDIDDDQKRVLIKNVGIWPLLQCSIHTILKVKEQKYELKTSTHIYREKKNSQTKDRHICEKKERKILFVTENPLTLYIIRYLIF